MHRRCLPLWLSSVWPVGERQDGGTPHSWLSPSPSLKEWKTMTDKTLKVRSSPLWCSTAPGLGSGSAQAQFCCCFGPLCCTQFHMALPLFRATSQSRVHRFSESNPRVTSRRSGKVVSGSSRGWGLQGWPSNSALMKRDRNGTLLRMWSLFFPPDTTTPSNHLRVVE